MLCKLPPSTPKCSLYAKTFKKTQIPVYDALGPFPDEPLMSSVDRVLFLFGGRRIQKYFNHSERSSIEDFKRSTTELVKQDKCRSRCHCSSDECYLNETSTYSTIPKFKCCKKVLSSDKSTSYHDSSFCRCSNTSRRSIKENSHRQESGKIGIPLRALKRSFSLCSLACRKLKQKLSFASPCTTQRPFVSSQWLWTKVENYADGCQVYEVFKNSSAAAHPTKFDTCKASKIIFVILPTGIIMPFETLPRH